MAQIPTLEEIEGYWESGDRPEALKKQTDEIAEELANEHDGPSAIPLPPPNRNPWVRKDLDKE